MNLSSCELCGIVYDKHRIPMPDIFDDGGCIDTTKARYNRDDKFDAIIECPNCRAAIFYDSGEEV